MFGERYFNQFTTGSRDNRISVEIDEAETRRWKKQIFIFIPSNVSFVGENVADIYIITYFFINSNKPCI